MELTIWYRTCRVGHKVERPDRACPTTTPSLFERRGRRDHRRAAGLTEDTALDAIAKLMIGLLPARLTQPAAPLKLQVGAHTVAGESERLSK
jgi:hypothetical protein